MTRTKSLFTLGLATTLLLVGCTTATPYQPLTPGSKVSGGYSEQRLEDNRFRVTFSGNTLTSRQQVENYLLYRAAELTVEAGYDGFTMVTRAVDPTVHTSYFSAPYGPGWGWWGPSWRYRYGGAWNYWDPWGPYPWWGDTVDVHTVTQFDATAEIIMFKGRRSDDPYSFDAHQVMGYLGSTIRLPDTPQHGG